MEALLIEFLNQGSSNYFKIAHARGVANCMNDFTCGNSLKDMFWQIKKVLRETIVLALEEKGLRQDAQCTLQCTSTCTSTALIHFVVQQRKNERNVCSWSRSNSQACIR